MRGLYQSPVGTGDLPVADWQKREKAASGKVGTGDLPVADWQKRDKDASRPVGTGDLPVADWQKCDKGASRPVRTGRDRRPPGRRLGKNAIKLHQNRSGEAGTGDVLVAD